MERILKKDRLPSWLQTLEGYRIYLPVKKEERWYFEARETPGEIPADYTNTLIPPKFITFPQREELFRFNAENHRTASLEESLPSRQPSLIVGVRPCDASAMLTLGEIFSNQGEDIYVSTRAKGTLLVGLACTPPPWINCFCTSLEGSPFATRGLDLLLTDLGQEYFLESFTSPGEELMQQAGNNLTPPGKTPQKTSLLSGTTPKTSPCGVHAIYRASWRV